MPLAYLISAPIAVLGDGYAAGDGSLSRLKSMPLAYFLDAGFAIRFLVQIRVMRL